MFAIFHSRKEALVSYSRDNLYRFSASQGWVRSLNNSPRENALRGRVHPQDELSEGCVRVLCWRRAFRPARGFSRAN
eukprot:10335099-Lingulodinium_polyedra.AAC.1